MIMYYHWPEHYLLVTFAIRGGNQHGILAERASQEEIMEHITQQFSHPAGDREIVQFSVQELSEEVYDMLLPLYEARGDTRVVRGN